MHVKEARGAATSVHVACSLFASKLSRAGWVRPQTLQPLRPLPEQGRAWSEAFCAWRRRRMLR
eukprot:NODE_17527_length_938_cov_3.139334.p5 GENE.NODE_17527_length_938_cov_3.139334~~NODE_17527_length_938_cov_3.139334.p5  ORF type:complete len:63 (-),score=3.24 NODE_17527_length_938_cov_3.139334:107-295(-)